MERFLYKQLLQWKDSSERKPLILEGARQVGKTWLMKELLQFCNSSFFGYEAAYLNTKVKNIVSPFLFQADTLMLPFAFEEYNVGRKGIILSKASAGIHIR